MIFKNFNESMFFTHFIFLSMFLMLFCKSEKNIYILIYMYYRYGLGKIKNQALSEILY